MSGVALALVLLSALMHVAWNTAMRGSGTPTAFLLAMEWLSLLLLAPMLALLPFAGISGRVWAIGVVSGAVHAVYGYALSRAYAWGELSLVYPIARSTPALLPLFAVAFAVLWLRPGPVRVAGALANVTGVALIALGG